jgi:multicomponent Na+:H+ antiporter subunit D
MQARDWIAVGTLTASTLLNAAYFLPIVYRAFLVPAANGHGPDHAHGEAPVAMVAAQTFTAAVALAIFLFPGPVIALARSLAGG